MQIVASSFEPYFLSKYFKLQIRYDGDILAILNDSDHGMW